MREPLEQFAARLVRNDEVGEFIRGLCDEHGVDPGKIRAIGDSIDSERGVAARGGRTLLDRKPRPIGRDEPVRDLDA